MPSRFVIMSLPRCGSTTLMHILNCHPDIRCLREPFNPDQAGNTYLGQVYGASSLDLVIRRIWRDYNGVKHVWEPSGWPFGRGLDYNLRLATQPGVRVLLLTRANYLRRAVSYEVAAQTNLWHRAQAAVRDPGRPGRLRPLDPARLCRDIQLAVTGNEILRSVLRVSGTPFLEVTYEEIYAAGQPAAGLRQVAEMLGFLSAEPLPGGGPLDDASRLLNPRRSKLNSDQTYRAIPNIADIEAACGTGETGFLFTGEQAACGS